MIMMITMAIIAMIKTTIVMVLLLLLLMPVQGLPTSPVTIASTALQKRESLSRDVKRELAECLQSIQAAVSEQQCGDGATGRDGGASEGFGSEQGFVSVEDDMFTFDDEPCNVRRAAFANASRAVF